MVAIRKKTWWDEMKFSQDLGAPAYRNSHDLKKCLKRLCFGSCYQIVWLSVRWWDEILAKFHFIPP